MKRFRPVQDGLLPPPHRLRPRRAPPHSPPPPAGPPPSPPRAPPRHTPPAAAAGTTPTPARNGEIAPPFGRFAQGNPPLPGPPLPRSHNPVLRWSRKPVSSGFAGS